MLDGEIVMKIEIGEMYKSSIGNIFISEGNGSEDDPFIGIMDSRRNINFYFDSNGNRLYEHNKLALTEKV